LIDTVNGAKASAVIYSLVETAKLYDLHPGVYLRHLLTVIPEHQENTNLDFLDNLMPWSEAVKEKLKH